MTTSTRLSPTALGFSAVVHAVIAAAALAFAGVAEPPKPLPVVAVEVVMAAAQNAGETARSEPAPAASGPTTESRETALSTARVAPPPQPSPIEGEGEESTPQSTPSPSKGEGALGVSGEVAPGSEARLRPEDFGKSASEVDAPKPVTDTPKPAEPKPLARPAPKKSKPAPEPVQTALANDAPREAPPMSVPAAYPATDATGTAAVARAIDAAKEVAAGASAEPLALRSGNAPPEYPDLARRRGWEGRVVLKVVVDIAGAATDVAIGRTSGFRILDESAVAAVRRWRFEPARLAGIPVVATVDVPVAFRLTD